MRPSDRFFLDPNALYRNPFARHRAKWLVADVSVDVESAPELSRYPPESGAQPSDVNASEVPAARPGRPKIKPFPAGRRRSPSSDELTAWRLVAGVAEDHPKLLAWLVEGQVTWYWNVFGTVIAVLRRIRGVRWIVWHSLFEPVARTAPWRTELLEAILQQRRWQLNNEPDSNARLPTTTLTILPVPGLSAVTDVATVTQNAACDDTREKIEKMSSGCVGVSGDRGSGKSTLIRDFCHHRYGTPTWPPPSPSPLPGLRLMVQVPLPYGAREFLIHLYTCLCKAVLADARLNAASSGHLILALVARSIRPAWVLRALSGIALVILTVALAWRAATGRWPVPSWPEQAWAAVAAAAAFVAAAAVFGWRTRQALIEAREVITLATDAQARLERLHFQRTETRSRAGTLGGPMGTGLNLASSEAFTEQLMTLPELIDDYRDFAERTVAALQQAVDPGESKTNVRLVIGIDQMDQIDDAQEASRFLNELSAVFGTPHCVYLIAVSPDTLGTTSQRMVPLKTASGGVFDEMVWIDALNLDEARDLLDRRVIGLPPAFVALCYVLSGGLPRDLLRVARGIFTTCGDDSRTKLELAEATRNVITDEICALKHRSTALAAPLDIPARPDLLGLLSTEGWPARYLKDPGGPVSRQPIDIETILGEVSRLWAATARQQVTETHEPVAALTAEICDSFLVGIYFLLTVYQLFTAEPDTVTRLAVPQADSTSAKGDHLVLRDLAQARMTLGVNPYLASKIIRETRKTLSGSTDYPGLIADIEPPFLNPMHMHHNGPPVP